MKICNECGEEFENHKVYSNHVRWKHKKVEYKRTKCPYCDYEARNENYEKHLKYCFKNPINIINCLNCGKLAGGHKIKFCSQSCSAIYNNSKRDHDKIDRSYMTPEWKDIQRQKTLENWRDGKYSMERKITFSSKNERAVVKHIKETFPDDEWKSGGILKFADGNLLSRDLWSDKLKVCFEYDGIWHFKDIHGQLAKKQLKDRLLEEWCKEKGYRLIRVDEDVYKNPEQIVDLIYHQSEQIIKLGNRY
jgi:hypothetical protein